MKKLSARLWLTLILIGLVGQFAWTIENMYFNVFLYNTISTDPGYISAMVGWSAAAATLTTLLMGALSGIQIRLEMPFFAAASATPWAWLPADDATTPHAFSSSESWLIL